MGLSGIAGCGRVAFDPADASVTDGAPPSCWNRWLTGDVTFSDVRRLDELPGGARVDPSLSPDGSALFYMSGDDLYVAARSGSVWTMTRRIDELSTGSLEARLTLADDGSAVFSSNRTPSQGPDLWATTRDAATGMFSPPTQSLFAAVNSVEAEGNPELDPSGTELHYTRDLQIWRTTRPSGGTFGTPTVVAELDPLDRAVDASLARDGRVAVFAASGGAVLDLWFATRATTAIAFGPATELTALNMAPDDADPELSADGCELYFSRALAEIWVATLTP